MSSRFLEMVGLGGLVGLLAFRWLVWGPARARRGRGTGTARRVLGWGRDVFWVGFGALAVGAMLAEGYLLVVQSASVLGTGVVEALGDATGISQVLGDTRFGSLVQLRGALLFGLFAIGAIQFIREYGNAGSPRPPSATGSRVGALVMAALLLAVLGGIAAQGHASVAPWSGLQVAAQLVHIVAVAVWISGLALVALTYRRLPAVAPEDGPALSTRVLARFSRVAADRRGPGGADGRDPLAGRARRPRRAVGHRLRAQHPLQDRPPASRSPRWRSTTGASWRRCGGSRGPTCRRCGWCGAWRHRSSRSSLAVVVIASLLVAQVPGGT